MVVAQQQYSFEEAFNIVEDLAQKVNHMPYHEEYERFGYGDAKELALALNKDAEREMWKLGIRPFAIVSIAVLRERRRRAGQPIIITQAWEQGNATLFENKFPEDD
ncbi:MAG: hypothetical protein Q4F58_03445 [Candidatus Saccharibacteria bacterium]|nr:hypothetical protein [Candidatus Saccharibacteria bacterium]